MKKVPERIIFAGDKREATKYIKEGRSQLDILRNQLKFGGLKQGHRTTRFSPTVVIDTNVCHNEERITINVTPPRPQGGERSEKEREATEWYWYAICISTKPDPNDATRMIPVNGGENMVDVAVSNSGNVYTCGMSNTAQDLDYSNDAAFIKYSNDGDYKGRKIIIGGYLAGDTKNEAGTGVATVVGAVYHTADVYQERYDSNYDTNLLKTTPGGTFIWSRRLTYTTLNYMLLSWGVETAKSGNVYLNGLINRWENVNPYNYLDYRPFLVSFDEKGDLRWKKELGDRPASSNIPNAGMFKATAIDGEENIFTVGPRYELYSFGADLFPSGSVIKFNSAGTAQWAKMIQIVLRQPNDAHTWAGDGLDPEGCSVDDEGAIYCISKSNMSLNSEQGYLHMQITKIDKDGNLIWMRIFEVSFLAANDAADTKVSIATGKSGVYVVFTQPASLSIKTGSQIIKLRKKESPDGIKKGGDIIWQRHVTLNPSSTSFTNVDGILLYNVKTDKKGNIYLVGQVHNMAAALTMKLPSSGTFLGKRKDLLFTDIGLTAYQTFPINGGVDGQPAWYTNAPVRKAGGSRYEYIFHSDFTLNVVPGTMDVTAPTVETYMSPVRQKTHQIIKRTTRK